MNEQPLLLRACIAGAFGNTFPYEQGTVYNAGFIYLDGTPQANWLEALKEQYMHRMFVPLSEQWEQKLSDKLLCTERSVMHLDMNSLDVNALESFILNIPSEYRLSPFTKEIFDRHPFRHGANYRDHADFQINGSGFAVLQGNEIVSSASGFLTYQKETELDVSTLPEHRKKHLALACCAAMLLDCRRKGLLVH